jgi:hypothetical protein
MNQPFNPVLKPGTLSLKAEDRTKQAKAEEPVMAAKSGPTAGKTLTRLTMPEDYKLTQWLIAHEMKPGETLASLAHDAGQELNIPKININHVQVRMNAFGIQVIPKAAAKQLTRLDKLERIVATLITRGEDGKMLNNELIVWAKEILA